MQQKTPYPNNGLLYIPETRRKGTYWYIGQGNFSAGKGKRINKYYFLQKTEGCDRHHANGCNKRSAWYGYETIGPRVYALYRCPDHRIFRIRLIKAGPEAHEYLEKKDWPECEREYCGEKVWSKRARLCTIHRP